MFIPGYYFPIKKKNTFEKISEFEITTKGNELYSQINSLTKKISSYFEGAIQKFPSLFENNIKTFEESLNYLEEISIPNKSVCAGIIDTIPGFHCIDCSLHENTVYCSDCFIKSKNLHKNHKVEFLYLGIGMCDCGDPDALNTYCFEHSGPLKEKKEIEEYIIKTLGEKIFKNLKNFFDEFFSEFSKYLILTEKCDLFMGDIFNEIFGANSEEEELFNEKKDIYLLKSNFCIVFKNFIYFLRLITKNNFGMFHLIANYFLKNNLENLKLENEYLTQHSCIEINKEDIKIFFNSNEKINHNCKCPFLRLFLSNYRDNIKLEDQEDEQFFFSFSHNLPLRKAYGIIYFFLYEQNIYNNNRLILVNRSQFYLEDVMELIAKKTNIFENVANVLYKYISKIIKKIDFQKLYGRNNSLFLKIGESLYNISIDLKYFSKPKVRLLITEKIPFYKNMIDIICLFHNINEYKSIIPHPSFQEKSLNTSLFILEDTSMKIFGMLTYSI